MPESSSKDTQDDLIASINESTKHLNTFTLSFFATCIYIAIAVASVSHEVLLRGSDVNLPLLNVKVPLVHFFHLAPLIIVFLHLHLLLQEYFQFCKLKLLSSESMADGVAARFFPGLPVNSFTGTRYRPTVQLMLRLLRFGIYQTLPLLLLCWIQVRFLPYHGWDITLWHQALVVLDILLVSYYSRKLSLLRKTQPAKLRWLSFPLRRWGRRLALLAVAAFSLFYAVVPGTWLELEQLYGKPMPLAERLGLRRNLSLRESTLVREEIAPELLAARNVTPDTLDATYLELARGIDLANRDLRYANFTSSKLFNADLRGADLSGAILVNVDLRGAALSPDANHGPVRFAGADLRNANLQDLKLFRSDFASANLQGADLRRTDLSRSHLEFANLVDAKMTGSKLFNAVLVGTDLRGAYLEGADLTDARLDGAILAEAHLEGTQLKGTSAFGTIFSNSWLQGATSLVLNGVILRQARMQFVDFCLQSDPHKGPMLTDLRGVDFTTPTKWDEIMARLREGARGEPKIGIRRPRENMVPCLVVGRNGKARPAQDMAHRQLLYDDGSLEGPMKEWPPLVEQGLDRRDGWNEVAFSENLATALWNRACQDPDPIFAQALVKRAFGSYPSSDPLLNMHLALRFMQLQGEKCQEEQPDADTAGPQPCPAFTSIEEEDGDRIIQIARSSPLCTNL